MTPACTIHWNPPVDESKANIQLANEVLASVSRQLRISPPLIFSDDRRTQVVVPGCSPEEVRDALGTVVANWRDLGLGVQG